ncbi:MAG: alkyl hydroperoxide reductase subunit F [Lautropia sp.]|nr:alkyl hydroperoxide reductase subunit F [Lautropia sp.]
MLDSDMKAQLQTYLGYLKHPIELVATLDDSAKAKEMHELLADIAGLSDKVSLREDPAASVRKPSFAINRTGTNIGVRFAAIPLGHEFTSLVLALLHVGGHTIKLDADTIKQTAELDGDYDFEVYMSLSCQNCPDVVQSLNSMSVINPKIRVQTIDGALFQDEVEKRGIMAVPTVFLNGEVFFQGRSSAEEILAKLDKNADARAAAKISDKAPFDVLVVGGGPAGAAAAVYAARKGIRTGVVAERFGGQVLDTMAIENYISVLETEGPKFGAALEAHVRHYDVDIMNLQRVESISRDENADMVIVKTASGATLQSKTVVLATGARWRNVGVPGEQEYRNQGVAYCPHCDGPLFKGKRTAVIGGGNSGVEAAIDLAGIVDHVTLFEFMPELRADAVLQRKLESLPNVTILKNVQVTEIKGTNGKVSSIVYKDRATDTVHEIELAGIFVQIGLVPNTDFLKGTIDLSRTGEIEVDARCHTSMTGVFAAGDCTTVPYKQIIIAAGEGAKASLSAFDHLIRHSTPSA